jgi:hypothetical protein
MAEISTFEQCLAFVNRIERELGELDAELAEAQWAQYRGVAAGDPDEIQRRQADLLLNFKLQKTVSEWLGRSESVRLNRQIWLLNRRIQEAKVTLDPDVFTLRNALERRCTERGHGGGESCVARSELLRTVEQDPHRQRREEAWRELYAGGSESVADVTELVRLRNLRARDAGYPDFPRFACFLDDITLERVDALLHELLGASEEAWKGVLEAARRRLGFASLHPWDVIHYLERTEEPLDESLFPQSEVLASFQQLLRDSGSLHGEFPCKVEFCDIPFGGITFVVRPGQDVRVLANPQDGHHGYQVLFHEFGHGYHAVSILEPSVLIARGDPVFIWEGLAGFFAGVLFDERWLVDHFYLEEDEVREFLVRRRAKLLYDYRRLAADALFELMLYREAPEDPDALYQEMVGRHLGLVYPPGNYWAGDPIFATHPLFLAGSLVAEAFAAQLRAAVRERFHCLVSRSLLPFLKDHFISAGGLVPWRQKIEAATGDRLRSDSLIAELAGAPGG